MFITSLQHYPIFFNYLWFCWHVVLANFANNMLLFFSNFYLNNCIPFSVQIKAIISNKEKFLLSSAKTKIFEPDSQFLSFDIIEDVIPRSHDLLNTRSYVIYFYLRNSAGFYPTYPWVDPFVSLQFIYLPLINPNSSLYQPAYTDYASNTIFIFFVIWNVWEQKVLHMSRKASQSNK